MLNTKKFYILGSDIDKRVLLVIPILGILAYFISSYCNSFLKDLIDSRISFTIITGILLFVVNKVSFKWLLNIFNIPNINGVWDVFGKSSFDDTNFNGKAYIRQGLFTIDIKIEFTKSNSINTTASFYNTNTDHWIFYYQYENIKNKEANEDMKEKHVGATYINIVQKENQSVEMNGYYVTEPGKKNDQGCINNGTLNFTKIGDI